jgi:hypothetical protein
MAFTDGKNRIFSHIRLEEMEGHFIGGLAGSGLVDYPFINLDNRYKYYYKRVYMSCIPANDYLCSMPEFNGDLAVYGGSQAGRYQIVTAALDNPFRWIHC